MPGLTARFVAALSFAVLWAAGSGAQPSGPQRGQPPKLEAPERPKQAMHFELVREGPPEACGGSCREWISASGRIVPSTGRDFESFAATHDVAGKVLVLESPGGAVTAGLALGRAFRRFNLTVTVGHTAIGLPDTSGIRRASYSPKGICASMCPFVLLGGARRNVPPEARIRVHQIWPGAARADSTAAVYSAQNVAALLRGTAEMARYTVDMGGEIELFDLSMRIPPWENLRVLTRAEILRTRLSTTDTPFPRPTPDAAGDVPPGVLPATGGKPIPLSRWALLGEGADRGITRRHPLTIYGEEIGTFIITIACGETPERLSLRYWETRRLANAGDVLQRALVVLGKDRVDLAIDSSGPTGGRLESTAHGTVAAALVTKFTIGQTPVTVATLTSGKVQTAIHVGNTGLSATLPKLTEACGR
jgi:hypothetical protein